VDVADGRAWKDPPARRRLLSWSIAATLGGFLFGYHLGVISGALLFIRRDFGLGAFEQGLLVSAVLLGAMAGGLVAAPLADAVGRRRALILIAVLFIVATVLATVAPGYGTLLVARGLAGVGVGAASSTTPLYLSEIAPPRVRGRLVTLFQLMVTLGIVVSYGVGLAFSRSGDWRAMFAVGLVPAALLLAGMLRAPETPAWLDAHGETEQARRVLLQVVDEDEAERLLRDLGRPDAATTRTGARALLHSRAAAALLIGVTLAAVQQLSGINAVIAYAPAIMERTGLTASNSILYSLPIALANVGATLVSIRLVDRSGRRPLLLASTAGAFASLVLLGLTFEVGLGDWGTWLSLACLLAYIVAFAIGLGPVFWVLIAEIFPPEARAAGAGVATAVNWFTSFVVGLTFAPLADAIGEAPTFWMFAAFCALGFAFARRYVPETKGRTFHEIDAELHARVGHGHRHAALG
jgi:SP family galactose:H+ symporter-like MFS transporter